MIQFGCSGLSEDRFCRRQCGFRVIEAGLDLFKAFPAAVGRSGAPWPCAVADAAPLEVRWRASQPGGPLVQIMQSATKPAIAAPASPRALMPFRRRQPYVVSEVRWSRRSPG